MAYRMPRTTHGPSFWEELFTIYQELGHDEFLDWAEKAVRPQEAWEHSVKMMAWNDRNSEFNLDRNIAESRKNREGERITEADVAAALDSMLEGMGPAQSPLFLSPKISITPGARDAIAAAGQDPSAFLDRHFYGDWGELDAHDKAMNDGAVRTKDMILSVYRTSNGVKFYIITDPGHETTTILLPEER